MDFEKLLEQAREALRNGVSADSINSKLAELTEGEVENLETLQQLAAGEDPERQEALQRTAEADHSPFSQFARMMAQGASLGFADELTGLGAAVIPGGKGYTEARDASRQRVEDIRELNPGSALAGEFAGIAAGGATGGGLLALGRGARGLGGLLRAGSRTTPIREGLRAAGRGAGLGGAEEAVRGAGEAEGGLLERAEAGAKRAPAGLLAGGLFGGGIGAAGAARKAFRTTRRAGEVVADDLLETANRGIRRRPSVLRESAEELKDEARTVFKRLERAGPIDDVAVNEVVVRNPAVRAELARVAETSPEARKVLAGIEDFQAGNRGSTPAVPFTVADDIAKNLKSRADFYVKGGPMGARPGRADEVRQAARAFDELDTAMKDALDDFPEAKQAWGKANSEMRALSEGRKLWGKNADDVRSAMEKVPEGEAREFFRQGLINEAVGDLERFRGSWRVPPSAANKFFNRGRGYEEELRLLFPSDEAFEEFARRVDMTQAATSAAQKAAVLTQAVAFLTGGTSIFGRLF